MMRRLSRMTMWSLVLLIHRTIRTLPISMHLKIPYIRIDPLPFDLLVSPPVLPLALVQHLRHHLANEKQSPPTIHTRSCSTRKRRENDYETWIKKNPDEWPSRPKRRQGKLNLNINMRNEFGSWKCKKGPHKGLMNWKCGDWCCKKKACNCLPWWHLLWHLHE